MTIAEKREIVNTIINLLLQLTAEEEVQEQPATSSKPVKAPAQSVRMLTIKECTALIEGISEHSIRMLIAQGKIKAFRTGEGVRGKYLVNMEILLSYFSGNEDVSYEQIQERTDCIQSTEKEIRSAVEVGHQHHYRYALQR